MSFGMTGLRQGWRIRKEIGFEAAHQIVGHTNPDGSEGKCSRVHGHSYILAVQIEHSGLQPIQFGVDYYWIGVVLKMIEKDWDHHFLNDLLEFRGLNTTAEVMAYVACERIHRLLWEHCGEAMSQTQARVRYAEIQETRTTYARFYPSTFAGSDHWPDESSRSLGCLGAIGDSCGVCPSPTEGSNLSPGGTSGSNPARESSSRPDGDDSTD